jgi:nitroreductase
MDTESLVRSITNPVLEAITNRRSIIRFEETAVEEEKVQAILYAGRWAPSALNRQPWRFIVVREPSIKEALSEYAPTIYRQGMREAPLCIVITVDSEEEPWHFVEDGSAATQNMALAAHSLGLGSCWIGVFRLEGERGSSEEKIKNLLEIPNNHRVISLLPIGIPKHFEEKDRKPLTQIVYHDKFGKRK